MNLNPLDPLWEDYKTARDSLKVFKRAVKTDQTAYRKRLLQRTFLVEEVPTFLTDDYPSDQVKIVEDAVEKAVTQAENLFVVGLWAVFERFLRTYLQHKGLVLETVKPNDLGKAIYDHFKDEVEYWKPDEILDFLKFNVLKDNEELAGDAKHIYRYRSAIVHGKQFDEKIYPDVVHTKLSKIVSLLQQVEEPGK